MASPCFTSWTVLPHGPLQKLEDKIQAALATVAVDYLGAK
jgi:hypothetical protein